MKRFPLLLMADAADGGQNTPAPAPPPSTKIVVEGTKTEREIELERDRDAAAKRAEDAEAGRKKAEVDAAHHQSEAQRLREIQGAPPKPAKKVQQFGFFKREV